MTSIKELEKKLTEIEKKLMKLKKRNIRVETDKAWETSLTRKIIIFAVTYIVIVLFFFFANLPNPLINSIVPALGFMLSTLSLPYFKSLWSKTIYKK
ncbi:MAG: hypothetical protein ABH821_04135 [archaeon]